MSKTEATIRLILTAAEALFIQRNYADVSMRDIAEAAQLTTGAVYHHFPSKETLYLAMLKEGLARQQEAMVQATPAQGSCYEKLRGLTRIFLAMPAEQRNVMRLVRRDINVFKGETRQTIVDAYQTALPQLVEPILKEGMTNGEIRGQDGRWLSWVYIALVETTLAPYAEATLGDVDTRLDAVLDQFFYGASAKI